MTDEALRPPQFDSRFREQFEQLLVWRRDIRHFRTDPVDEALVSRLLAMACLAPSVGNAQPWRFVKVADPSRRAAVRANFLDCNADALNDYAGERAKLYASLKLSGLDDAPVHLAVFSDRGTTTGHGLGRKTMPETLDFSVVAAVFSFWLAARAHGLGVGWVSILDPERVRVALDVPDTWSLVAYLCVGRPVAEYDVPELERFGWQAREVFGHFIFER
jgi:5,6-dimethylbenzimidazole synthase